MADDSHEDASSSQTGDHSQEEPAPRELSDEHDAVPTGFSVDESETQDFDAESGEYDAVPEEMDSGEADDEVQPAEGDDPAAVETDTADDGGAMHDGGMPDEEPPIEESRPEETQMQEAEADAAPADASRGDEPREEVTFEADDEVELEDSSAAAGGEADSDAVESTGPDTPLAAELDAVLEAPEPESVEVDPLPELGPYLDPATLTLWIGGDEHETFAVAQDELLLGRQGDGEDASEIDIDLGAHLEDGELWHRHATLYRHNRNYTLYVTSDGATQINDERLELGEHRRLEDGDVLIFGGEIGLEFNLPGSRGVAADSSPATPEDSGAEWEDEAVHEEAESPLEADAQAEVPERESPTDEASTNESDLEDGGEVDDDPFDEPE